MRLQSLKKEADNYEDEIGTYLVKVSMQELSDADSRDVTKILHSITDFERISDHALNIAQSAREMAEKKLSFSPAAQAELKVMTGAIDEIVGIAIGGSFPIPWMPQGMLNRLKRLLTSLTQTFAPRISNGLRTANAPLSWDLF